MILCDSIGAKNQHIYLVFDPQLIFFPFFLLSPPFRELNGIGKAPFNLFNALFRASLGEHHLVAFARLLNEAL